MEDIYSKIWALAKPYYLRGRSYDVPHIEWMMKVAEEIADNEGFDKKILLPIVILHDVGYSAIADKNPNVKGRETKIIHMREGAVIAENILKEVSYDPGLAKKIVRYVSVHDNWILGDDAPFRECREMALFNDLDFIWPQTSPAAFKETAESMGMTSWQSYDFWIHDDKPVRRPFCTPTTKAMFYTLVEERKKDREQII